MLQTCSHCRRTLPDTEFNWKFKYIRRSYHCKECSREYIKEHYNAHRKYYVTKARKRNIIVRNKIYNQVGAYLKSHPCVDCGETDIIVLEFDHKDRKRKKEAVAIMMRGMQTFERVLEEIVKCEVRCANCHRRKTAREDNNWRITYAPVA